MTDEICSYDETMQKTQENAFISNNLYPSEASHT